MRRERWLAALSLVLFLATLAALMRSYVFTADDVGLQTVLHTWRPDADGKVWVGEDTFLLKAPVYLVANAVGTSKAVLIGTSLVLNAIGWVLLVLGGRSLLRRWGPPGAGLPALLWLATLGGVFGNLILRPNIRNLEIGLAVFLVAWTAAFTDSWPRHGWRRRGLEGGALVVVLAALFVDDPYFAYVVFAPVAAVVGLVSLLVPARRATAWIPAAAVAAALVLWQLGFALLEAIGFHPTGEAREAPGVDEAGRAITESLRAVRTVANAGSTLTGQSWLWDVRAVVNLVVLVALLALGAWILARLARRDPWALALLALPVAVIGAHVLSGHSLRAGTERYVVLVVVLAAAFAAVALAHGSTVHRRAVLAAVVAGLLVNGWASAAALARDSNPGNVRAVVVPALRAEGLDRGYADFWYANTITYVSDFDIDALPVVCGNGITQPRLSYVDAERFDRRSAPSFYLYDPAFGSCAFADLETQFGPPARRVPLTLGRWILVYDYDIANRLRLGD